MGWTLWDSFLRAGAAGKMFSSRERGSVYGKCDGWQQDRRWKWEVVAGGRSHWERVRQNNQRRQVKRSDGSRGYLETVW